MSARALLLAGAALAFIAVLAGAFGAHALQARLEPRLLAAFMTGAQYQMYHALALLVLGAVQASPARDRRFALAGSCFAGAVLLFSGSLYLLALTGILQLGMITPAGGTLFLVGWGFALAAAWRHGR
jgi:uncharacterized membrane protein YgdD (TMEM256/DUF423 family)